MLDRCAAAALADARLRLARVAWVVDSRCGLSLRTGGEDRLVLAHLCTLLEVRRRVLQDLDLTDPKRKLLPILRGAYQRRFATGWRTFHALLRVQHEVAFPCVRTVALDRRCGCRDRGLVRLRVRDTGCECGRCEDESAKECEANHGRANDERGVMCRSRPRCGPKRLPAGTIDDAPENCRQAVRRQTRTPCGWTVAAENTRPLCKRPEDWALPWSLRPLPLTRACTVPVRAHPEVLQWGCRSSRPSREQTHGQFRPNGGKHRKDQETEHDPLVEGPRSWRQE